MTSNNNDFFEVLKELAQQEYQDQTGTIMALSQDDLGEIVERTKGHIDGGIRQVINAFIDHENLLDEHRDAKLVYPQFKLYWRNPNTYRPDFILTKVFKNEEAARNHIEYQGIDPFDEYKITRVVKAGGQEEELAIIKSGS